MGCCQHDHNKTEQKAESGCCGVHAMKKEESCCKGSKLKAFFKMLFGNKCCGSEECKPS